MKIVLKGVKIFLAINILLFITIIIAFVIINHNLKYEIPSNVIAIDLNPMTGFYPSFNEYYKKLYFKRTNIPWYIELLYHEQ